MKCVILSLARNRAGTCALNLTTPEVVVSKAVICHPTFQVRRWSAMVKNNGKSTEIRAEAIDLNKIERGFKNFNDFGQNEKTKDKDQPTPTGEYTGHVKGSVSIC